MIRVLLVEDDPSIVSGLGDYLRGEGCSVVSAGTQREALERFESGKFDIALVDLSLPDGSGFAVCAGIKQQSDTPVIFVTASGDEFSVVAGLDMGADDYIAKPYRPRELLSRIRSVLRRSGRLQNVVTLGPIRVDTERASVTRDGRELFLSALEYRLLLAFVNNPGIVLTRARLLEEIWDAAGDYVTDNTLTVYVKRLREKLGDDPADPKLILTVRGIGYKMAEDVR